jgi:hypothetical protein
VTTKYCPECGTGHECETASVLDPETAAVRIARLETARDIRIAEINAGAVKHVAEVGAESEAEHAEGVVEGLELAAGGLEPEAAEGEPIAVSIPEESPEPAGEPAADMEPPVVDIPEPANRNPGWWDAY